MRLPPPTKKATRWLLLPSWKPWHHLPHPLLVQNFIPLSMFPTLGIIFILLLTWKSIAKTQEWSYFLFMFDLTRYCIISCLQITSLNRLPLTHHLGCNHASMDLFHYLYLLAIHHHGTWIHDLGWLEVFGWPLPRQSECTCYCYWAGIL